MARRRMLGSVDLLGLNSFGQNPGMSPIWGSLIGGGVAGVTSLVLRRVGKGYPEAFGLLTGLAVSGGMYAMRSTRHAAVASAVGAFLATGISLFERLLSGGGLGIANIRALNGLGVPMIRNLNGLGVPMISQNVGPVGTIPGVAGNQLSHGGLSAPPVSLLGNMSPQAAHLKGIGGPSVHGLSAAYGATLLGGGR